MHKTLPLKQWKEVYIALLQADHPKGSEDTLQKMFADGMLAFCKLLKKKKMLSSETQVEVMAVSLEALVQELFSHEMIYGSRFYRSKDLAAYAKMFANGIEAK